MKIYEVVCNCNSVGFYFSRAKALAEVRRQIIIENEFDYPEYNPQFLKMMQEIDETGYTVYDCHDYAIYEGNLIDDDEDKIGRSNRDYLILPPAERADAYIERNFKREVNKVIERFAKQLFNVAFEKSISETMPAALVDSVVAKLKELNYSVDVYPLLDDMVKVTITW